MLAHQNRSTFYFLVLSALVIAACVGIVQSSLFLRNPAALGIGITCDFLVTIPTLYYFLIVRSGRAPAISLLAVFLVCLRGVQFVLPAAYRGSLYPLLLLAAPLELVAVGLFIHRVRRIATFQRSDNADFLDPLERFEQGARSVYGDNRLVDIVLSELSVFYFAFVAWFVKSVVPKDVTAITCYKKSGWGGIVVLLSFLILLEGSVVHFLLQKWNGIAAWIWTGFDLYAIIWLLADYQALRHRPLLLTTDSLHIRLGLRWHGTIPLSQIQAVVPYAGHRPSPKRTDYLKLALLSDPEFIVVLHEPLEVRGLMGIRKKVRFLGILADSPELYEQLQQTK